MVDAVSVEIETLPRLNCAEATTAFAPVAGKITQSKPYRWVHEHPLPSHTKSYHPKPVPWIDTQTAEVVTEDCPSQDCFALRRKRSFHLDPPTCWKLFRGEHFRSAGFGVDGSLLPAESRIILSKSQGEPPLGDSHSSHSSSIGSISDGGWNKESPATIANAA